MSTPIQCSTRIVTFTQHHGYPQNQRRHTATEQYSFSVGFGCEARIRRSDLSPRDTEVNDSLDPRIMSKLSQDFTGTLMGIHIAAVGRFLNDADEVDNRLTAVHGGAHSIFIQIIEHAHVYRRSETQPGDCCRSVLRTNNRAGGCMSLIERSQQASPEISVCAGNKNQLTVIRMAPSRFETLILDAGRKLGKRVAVRYWRSLR
jgi:hypothetical protein